jgi:hypothetical protein
MMRCAHAEKLIPLLAGDDLPARQADALRTHLDSCANCRRLAAEFEESRDWMRGFPAPRFDEAALNDLRDSVLNEIGRTAAPRRWSQWIVPGWNPRFATSVATALLIALFAAYAYRGGRPYRVHNNGNVAQDGKDELKKNLTVRRKENREDKVAPSPAPIQQSPRKRPRGMVKNPKAVPIQLPEQPQMTVALVPAPAPVETMIDPPVGAPGPDSDVAAMREMTRIEFQTADPNIRIIWFAPKSDASQSQGRK